jgi:hypothetical protein
MVPDHIDKKSKIIMSFEFWTGITLIAMPDTSIDAQLTLPLSQSPSISNG